MSIQDDNHAVRRGLRVWPGVQLMSQAMVVACQRVEQIAVAVAVAQLQLTNA